MKINKSKMLEIVRKQLAIDMNCNIEDFLKDGIVFCEAKSNEGRRMFDRQSPFLEIATMGKSTVVSADSDILIKLKPLLKTKTREDIFVAPFLFGHSLYYIPDCDRIKRLSWPDGFTFHIKEGKEIYELYKISGFENVIQYNVNHPCPDIIVIYAMCGNEIVAMSGASADSGTASSNIASQSVAYRSGFMPAWMCSYKNTFDGRSPYERNLKIDFK